MDAFNEMAERFTPMIYHVMNSLHIYKNQEEFFQIGLIALWDASERLDPEKGELSSYAYSYMKGRMMMELTKYRKDADRNVYPDDEFWEMAQDPADCRALEMDTLLSYCTELTDKQKKWAVLTFYHGLSVADIAKREGVSLSAVKKWRAGAMEKLRETAGLPY